MCLKHICNKSIIFISLLMFSFFNLGIIGCTTPQQISSLDNQNTTTTSTILASTTTTFITSTTSSSTSSTSSTSVTSTTLEKEKVETENETIGEPQGKYETGKVVHVVDGDTIDVLINGQVYRVRLIGMDTPERGRPYYKLATQKTKELTLGKQVKLEKDISETDRYGRLLRYVYVDKTFVNAELVKQGYAVQATFPPDVKYSDLFRKLAREARENQRGLWALPPNERPRTRD